MFNFDKEDVCLMILGFAVMVIICVVLGAVTHTL